MHNDRQEKEMRDAFFETAQRMIASPERFSKNGGSVRVGFESEVGIFSETIPPNDMEDTRDAILREIPDFTDVELGAAQIEFRTPPIDIAASGGFNSLRTIYETNFFLLCQAAKQHDTHILRVGSNPFLPTKHTPRTNKPKYRLVPDYYNEYRPKDANTFIGLGRHRIDIGDAAIVSLFQSFQVNVEALSFEDACDKMNRSFIIAPYLMALAANARYLEFLDMRMHDVRMPAWEKSHDTRMYDVRMSSWEKAFDLRTEKEIRTGHTTRIGLPEKYFKDVEEYLIRAGSFPFILYQPEAAFAIAIGMTWLDARIKFINDSLVVELRLLPTQPTIEEELLLTLFYVGRLTYAQTQNEPLLPIEYIHENRLSSMLYGTHRRMWFLCDRGGLKRLPYQVGITQEIKKAERGLAFWGLSKFFDKELLGSMCANGSPSERLARALWKKKSGSAYQRMKAALEETQMII